MLIASPMGGANLANLANIVVAPMGGNIHVDDLQPNSSSRKVIVTTFIHRVVKESGLGLKPLIFRASEDGVVIESELTEPFNESEFVGPRVLAGGHCECVQDLEANSPNLRKIVQALRAEELHTEPMVGEPIIEKASEGEIGEHHYAPDSYTGKTGEQWHAAFFSNLVRVRTFSKHPGKVYLATLKLAPEYKRRLREIQSDAIANAALRRALDDSGFRNTPVVPAGRPSVVFQARNPNELVMLVGGPGVNKATARFIELLPAHVPQFVKQDYWRIVSPKLPPSDRTNSDRGLLIADLESRTVVAAGERQWGTEAAVCAFCDPGLLAKITEALAENQSRFWAIVRTDTPRDVVRSGNVKLVAVGSY